VTRGATCFLVVGTALALIATANARPSGPGPLHVHSLVGAVTRLGTWNSDGARYPLLGVRLRATVCLRSAAQANNTYPSQIGISHYVVSGSPRRWKLVRATIDRAPWLVPFGETWSDSPCGPVVLEDSIPPTLRRRIARKRGQLLWRRSQDLRRRQASEQANDRQLRWPALSADKRRAEGPAGAPQRVGWGRHIRTSGGRNRFLGCFPVLNLPEPAPQLSGQLLL
jgi:hypothetical protein